MAVVVPSGRLSNQVVRCAVEVAVGRMTTSSSVCTVELSDGGRIPADTVLIGPRFKARVEPFDALGLHTIEHPSGLGDYVQTDANGATNVPGLYAAGNVTDPSQQVLAAAAAGSKVAALAVLSTALLLNPNLHTHLASGSVANYALTPAGWNQLIGHAAGDQLPSA